MATILIRDVPQAVHDDLLATAARNRRSKEKHALFLIETGLRARPAAKDLRLAAARVRAQCKGTATMEEILNYTEGEH